MRADGRRAASAAATRQAVINAARELLAEGRWSGFTLEAVASRAGVTRVTVYNQVPSKSGLLDAVLTDLVERAGMDRLLADTQEMTAEQARAFVVEQTCRLWHAERAVLRPLFGIAAIDKEIAENLAQREQWRASQLGQLLTRLLAETRLAPRLPRDAVLAGLRAVTSFPTYDALGGVADDPTVAAALIDRLIIGLTS